MGKSQPKIAEELDDSGLGSGIEMEIAEVRPSDLDSEQITHPFDPKQINIHTRPFTISEVVERLKNKEINLTPDFQRKGGIWKPVSKSRLIESILLRIPLPVFYVHQDSEEDWLIVDGLQRITTIKEFVLDKTFSLSEMEFLTEFDGDGFNDLPRPMQRRINEASLHFHLILPSTPKAVTRTIFRRINTGGLPLSNQEIRHALYQGNSTRLLIELVEHKTYRLATTDSIRDSRMGGREAILRFLAFWINSVDSYASNKDMDSFLSLTMESINQMEDHELNALKAIFDTAMIRSRAIFGEYAFRKLFEWPAPSRNPISKPLFETWSIGLAELSDNDFDKLKSKKQKLIKNFVKMMHDKYLPEGLEDDIYFSNSISLSTSGWKQVKYRFDAIEKLIDEIVYE